MFKFDLYDKLFGNQDDFEEFDDFDELDDVEDNSVYEQVEEEPKPRLGAFFERKKSTPNPVRNRVVPMPQPPVRENYDSEVIIIKPTNFQLTQRICNDLRSGRTVVCNMQGITRETARRAADYIMGAAQVLDAHLEQVADGIFVVAPAPVKLGTLKSSDRGSGFSNSFEDIRGRKVIDTDTWPEIANRMAVNN